MAEAERVLSELARAGMTREDHLVALGGGVVGDLAGFCAHTYQRGVPVVQVPTTLVAQVDSAYGGKTGVDLPEGKNYAGAYHLPAAVLADVEALATLPAEDLAAGFVEALKTGLLAGGRALGAGAVDRIARPGRARGRRFRLRSAQVRGRRRRRAGQWTAPATLNLGHTVGHAIETASGYGRYRHGEAIGLGLLAVLRLSEAPDLRDEVGEAYSVATDCRRRSTGASSSRRSSTPCSGTRSAPRPASASSCSAPPGSRASASRSIRLRSRRP